ncbi:hypothetical protein T4B_12434 [Trichinella pseudospiralis]|uniref:Uncharacterized protein n=1 Tax=Trichinella pseudospiralis TaxID=6337 RepID=A0A0V1J564_TRIPS|nr:hypothetical protein T4B_12434 [Trichinella pseudospiralis]
MGKKIMQRLKYGEIDQMLAGQRQREKFDRLDGQFQLLELPCFCSHFTTDSTVSSRFASFWNYHRISHPMIEPWTWDVEALTVATIGKLSFSTLLERLPGASKL